MFWQNRRLTNGLVFALNRLLAQSNATLKQNHIRRIHAYTVQSCLTNSWFSKLTGRQISKKEQQSALYLGAITPLLDDITDSEKLTSTEIWSSLQQLKDKPNQTALTLVKYLDGQLQSLCDANFQTAFKEALLAQDASLIQLQKTTLDKEILQQVTQNKGGSATFLYRMVLEQKPVEGEKEAIYTLGYLLQLINDVFDVYKDAQNEQQTLVTQTNDIKQLYTHFKKIELDFLLKWSKLTYPTENLTRSLTEIATILGRGHVCFNQLVDLQSKNAGTFQMKDFTRKQLICDMEKWTNIRASMRQSALILTAFNRIVLAAT